MSWWHGRREFSPGGLMALAIGAALVLIWWFAGEATFWLGWAS
jgi:hypothetical protein